MRGTELDRWPKVALEMVVCRSQRSFSIMQTGSTLLLTICPNRVKSVFARIEVGYLKEVNPMLGLRDQACHSDHIKCDAGERTQ